MMSSVKCLRCLLSRACLLLAAQLLVGAARAESACPPPLPTAAAVAARHEAARDRGLLWRVTRDGRSSWLYGTLHAGKPAWRRLGPRTAAALRASQLLALEIDPTDPALQQALSEIQPPQALPLPMQQRLAQAFDQACVAPETMVAVHPLLQAMMLTVLEGRWLGLDPGFSMERLLVAQARTDRRRVVSLETVAQQKEALVPVDSVAALQALDQTLTQLENQVARRVLMRLSRAWERGDLAALEDYEGWCECAATEGDKAFMRKLNDERNGPLADGIEALHARGQRVFAAVGALHMTGPQALPRLLRERGFRVVRVDFRR